MRNKYWSAVALLAVMAMLAAACTPAATATAVPTSKPADTAAPPTSAPAGGIDCMGAKSGDSVSMLYQWSGTEEEALNAILKPLVDACGIVLAPETGDQALLDTRVQAGAAPDVAFLNITQLNLYKDNVKALESLGGVKANYSDVFLAPGVIDGKWVGLPVKVV